MHTGHSATDASQVANQIGRAEKLDKLLDQIPGAPRFFPRKISIDGKVIIMTCRLTSTMPAAVLIAQVYTMYVKDLALVFKYKFEKGMFDGELYLEPRFVSGDPALPFWCIMLHSVLSV